MTTNYLFIKQNPVYEQLRSMESIKLDITNILTVVQRAEREKSEAVVTECIRFIRANLQQVISVSSPFELEGLSEEVIKRIASGCHHGDVEALKDKADRIKSKLYRHLTERLLEADAKPELGCPESAANVFRCSTCSRLFHPRIAIKVKCHPGNFSVDEHGGLLPKHTRNEQWNGKLYIRALYFRRKSWRHVYWKLWGDIHYLECVKCSTSFPCNQMGSCAYHPFTIQYASCTATANSVAQAPVGQFPCCKRLASRFDPWEMNSKGCRYRDHVVNPSNPTSLIIHREFVGNGEIICAANNETSIVWEEQQRICLNIENTLCSTIELSEDIINPKKTQQIEMITVPDIKYIELPVLVDSIHRRSCLEGTQRICYGGSSMTSSSESESDQNTSTYDTSTSSDDSDDDDDGSSIRSSSPSTTNEKVNPVVCWDTSRSRRYNHDVLRDYEQRRFREMTDELLKCRTHRPSASINITSQPSTSSIHYIRQTRLQQYETQRQVTISHPAGIYGRLEGEWKVARSSINQSEASGSATFGSTSGGFRPKATGVLAAAKLKQTKKN